MSNIPAPAPPRVVRPSDPIPGMDFVRRAIAIGAARGELKEAAKIARARWGEKAVVPAVTADNVSGDGLDTASIEFVNAVLEASAVGQTAGLRRRSAATRYFVNAGTVTGSWLGEGKSIPVLPFTFAQNSLRLLKVAAVAAFTDETLNTIDPRVEAEIRRDLIDGLATAIDVAYLDPANAGVSGQTPTSITNGLTPVFVAGGTLDDFRDGLSTMIANFGGSLSRAVFYGRPELYAMLHSQGFDTVGCRGGVLAGAPAIATKGLPNAGGYYQLVLADPGAIGYVDEPSKTSVVASSEAAIQLLDDPTNSSVTPTAMNVISLFQANATAIKTMVYANWQVEIEGAVSIMAALPMADVS